MTGHVRRRGQRSWELKFDVGTDPATGRRQTRYHTFKGTKREAELEMARLVAGASKGEYVDPSKVTVTQFLQRWERDWATGNVSPKTAERYGELIRKHVSPHIGGVHLQKLQPVNLSELYAKLLRDTGLAPRTVGHVHRVIHRALGHACKWGVVQRNVAELVDPPRVASAEISILRPDDVHAVLKGLRGRYLYIIAAVALATGMRRGEILALRWQDVDLDRAHLRVEQAIEETKAGLRFKAPKTKHGRRIITLPPSIVTDLRTHWKAQQERRLLLGMGKSQPDSLVFSTWEGKVRHPDGLSKEWRLAMAALKRPDITLHSLRHTHASQLIASGLDVLTISRRLGHGSPSITLSVYGHLFSNTDDRAAAIMEATFAAIGTDGER